MKERILFFLFLPSFLFSLNFTVASYNPENLFDFQSDGTEYKEFIPNSLYWDKKAFSNKINNTSKVINDLNADIIVLQEIENKNVLLELMKRLKYQYYLFNKKQKSAIGLAILSKFPIVKNEIIIVGSKEDLERNILKTTIQIQQKNFIVYANHWRSKRASESNRIKYALVLQNYLKYNQADDYIIVGDLNSNYDEFTTFKYEKTLNDTYGITGINQILNTVIKGNFVTKEDIHSYHQESIHFNPWLELPKEERFSLQFRGENGTPDNIILSKNLFDRTNFSYKENSFRVFKAPYLFTKKGVIQRWNKKKKNGFSDHLPILATFTTDIVFIDSLKKKDSINSKNIEDNSITSLGQLYEISTLNKPVVMKNLLVTYKSNNIIVFKGVNGDRSIQYYNKDNTNNFQLGYRYDVEIYEIDDYFGTKEIKKLKILSTKDYVKNIQDHYFDGSTKDLKNLKYQNEVVKNIRGVYLKKYLHYRSSKGKEKIRLYFRKGIEKPTDGVSLVVESGILSSYRSKIQIVINKLEDYKVYQKK